MKNRRDEQTMMNLILNIAHNDERIRSVIMNGSRTSPNAIKDIFQDYDIVYIVTDVESFVKDQQWIKPFGQLLIMQKPDELDENWPKCTNKFTYLMQFTDWNRIDLTLLHQNNIHDMHEDSQSILLLDKDHLIGKMDTPSDKDYFPQPPTEKQFSDCCNEFLWCSNNVAKGIYRKELTYAKYMAENILKEELIKLLIWYAGIKTHFSHNIGKSGKFLQNYIEPELWNSLVKTYIDADYNNMWKGLFEMCSLFDKIAKVISTHFHYSYNKQEYKAVINYLKEVSIFDK